MGARSVVEASAIQTLGGSCVVLTQGSYSHIHGKNNGVKKPHFLDLEKLWEIKKKKKRFGKVLRVCEFKKL